MEKKVKSLNIEDLIKNEGRMGADDLLEALRGMDPNQELESSQVHNLATKIIGGREFFVKKDGVSTVGDLVSHCEERRKGMAEAQKGEKVNLWAEIASGNVKNTLSDN